MNFKFCLPKNIPTPQKKNPVDGHDITCTDLLLLLLFLISFCREDLSTFILGQVTSRHEGGHKLRFSLYLSSQLMFGIIRVYQRQAAYLLGKEFRQHLPFSATE